MDRLDIDKINSLEHPLIARMYGGGRWPVHDIDVEAGLVRIDVCGKLQIKRFAEISHLYEANDKPHVAHKFYIDSQSWPRNEDGENKFVGDMTDEERRRVMDAARYRWLRDRDIDTIDKGGVFAGMTPKNVVLNGEDLDNAIDAAMQQS